MLAEPGPEPAPLAAALAGAWVPPAEARGERARQEPEQVRVQPATVLACPEQAQPERKERRPQAHPGRVAVPPAPRVPVFPALAQGPARWLNGSGTA